MVALVLALSGSFVALAAVSAIARLVMYLAVCLSTLVLRKRDREIAAQVGAHFNDPLQVVKPPTFTVPLGPVIPVLASIVALGILAGATQAHLIAGGAALCGRRRAFRDRAEDGLLDEITHRARVVGDTPIARDDCD